MSNSNESEEEYRDYVEEILNQLDNTEHDVLTTINFFRLQLSKKLDIEEPMFELAKILVARAQYAMLFADVETLPSYVEYLEKSIIEINLQYKQCKLWDENNRVFWDEYNLRQAVFWDECYRNYHSQRNKRKWRSRPEPSEPTNQ